LKNYEITQNQPSDDEETEEADETIGDETDEEDDSAMDCVCDGKAPIEATEAEYVLVKACSD